MIVVLADDFSGAAEVAGIASRFFNRVELATRFLRDCSAEVLVVDTDTRLCSDQEAETAIREVCREIKVAGVTQIFKKIDSVLRGPVCVEIEAALAASGLKRAVLAPANPSRNRVIQNGIYYCGGIPLHETEFARDPAHPATTSEIAAIVGGCRALLIPELESTACWKSVLETMQPGDLPVGAADFFTAWLAQFARTRGDLTDRPFPAAENRLWVCGSSTAWEQRREDFSRHGIPCVTAPLSVFAGDATCEEWIQPAVNQFKSNRNVALAFGVPRSAMPGNAATLLSAIAGAAFQIATVARVDLLFLEGGATARAVVDRFGGTRWVVVREWEPGVVVVAPSEPATGLRCCFVVKPGSYAWPEDAFGN